MPNADLQLTIGADSSAAAESLTQLKSSLSGLVSQVAGLRASLGALQSNVTALANGVTGLAANLKSAGAQGGEGLSALQKAGGGAASAMEGVTKNVSTLFKSAGDMGGALKAAGVVGGEGLAAIGDGAGAAVEVVGAVVQVALSAADAMSAWAASTLNSNSATAEARQHATDLTNAMSAAHTQFDKLGQTLGNAFAPVMTTVVIGLTNLAKGFDDSYSKGGIAKTIVDALVVSVKALAGVVSVLVTGWILQFDTIKGAIFSAGAVWQGFVDSVVDRAVEAGHQLWTLGKLAADALTGNVQQAAQDMKSGWATMQADARKAAEDTERNVRRIGNAFTANGGKEAVTAFQGEASVLASLATDQNQAPAPARLPSAKPTRPSGGANADCPCDPAAAAACEAQSQTAQANQTRQGVAQRAAINAAGNQQINTSGATVTASAVEQQAQQLATAADADRAKVESNASANRQITAANDKSLKAFESSMKGVVGTFTKGLLQMAEGTKSFSQVMRSLGQRVLEDVLNVVDKMVEKWLWGELGRRLATLTANSAIVGSNADAANKNVAANAFGNIKQIQSDAAAAAGKAYKANADIPPAPLWGIAAGAAAYAGVIAYEGLASAAGGYDVPGGVNPLTQLHAQEMVLPARLANPMRELLASYSGGSAPATGRHTFSFGDTVIHGAPNMSPADFRQALAEHRASVAEAVATALRSGWRPNYRQPIGAL